MWNRIKWHYTFLGVGILLLLLRKWLEGKGVDIPSLPRIPFITEKIPADAVPDYVYIGVTILVSIRVLYILMTGTREAAMKKLFFTGLYWLVLMAFAGSMYHGATIPEGRDGFILIVFGSFAIFAVVSQWVDKSKAPNTEETGADSIEQAEAPESNETD